MSRTFLDALIDAVKSAAAYNRNDVVAPVAVLWPDAGREWEEVVPRLDERIPLLVLGPYNPGKCSGPAVWIRCVIARCLPQAQWSDEAVPVVYLPGYSRSDLRAVEESPEELKPLAELQYRGVIWSQKNNRDWTLAAFLQSQAGGLGIPVAPGTSTLEALRRASKQLVDETLETLQQKQPLDAEFFNSIVAPDIRRLVLLWMNDPDGQKKSMNGTAWAAFCDQCKRDLGFDPEREGEITAAEKLGKREKAWDSVWKRFREAPRNYPNIPELLRKARPGASLTLFENQVSETWPQDNEILEGQLREELAKLGKKTSADIRDAIGELEQSHGHRRGWVWKELDMSPLASALANLRDLAQFSAKGLGAGSVDDLAGRYSSEGWKTDRAALRALAAVHEKADVAAVTSALRALYAAWLRDCCEAFQSAWANAAPQQEKRNIEPESGVVFVFVDGLRYDVAQALKNVLPEDHVECSVTARLAPLPTVTETAKPAASPVAEGLVGGALFTPATAQGSLVNIAVLRKLLEEKGYSILSSDETGDPHGAAWTECGRFDEIGHVEGWRLAHRAEEELETVSRRILELLNSGWREVRVVTDHGWLLLPGDLPTSPLPETATEVRKGRCARLKPGAKVDCQTVPWYWDPSVEVAVAPEIRCFVAGKDYEHGGLSPQEVVVPEIVVRSTESKVDVAFTEIKWVGLRCRLTLNGAFHGLSIDLRTKPADPATTVVEEPKSAASDGSASLVVADDSLEGSAAVVVVYSPERPDRVLLQNPTVIGG